ncbi:MAG TPA: glycoside hydrolase family 15 protein [Candidatus Krumholzibacteria bacterium]|nr:glycoside hydrolase family 15 protein [Candidatus Krumholzibacteria bacterium]
MSYLAIEDHGVIGDQHTVALVGLDGTIDFLCFPHFDSPSVFASLLDDEKGGSFRLAPSHETTSVKQQYFPDTNVLMTRFFSAEGMAEIIDYMPCAECGQEHAIYRRAHVIRGEVDFHMRCAPRFDYARADHRIERRSDGVEFHGEDEAGTTLQLRSSVPVETDGPDATAGFRLRAGQTADFVLSEVGEIPPTGEDLPIWCDQLFDATVEYWRNWVRRSAYHGRWKNMVDRSALTLKLLSSRPTGAFVAAPTFGLPERVGGDRNWDYRYAWIRDSSFTLYALIRLGYREEAVNFIQWLVDRTCEIGPGDTLQIMYGLDGRRRLPETRLDHLEGHRGSRPVRIGNDAYDQLQLDIYGELMDSCYLFDKHVEPISYELWQDLVQLIEWVRANWDRADEGIWEVRGGRRHFLHSRLMCWVAVDRAIRLARKRSLPADLDGWLDTRDTIYRQIHDEFFDADLGIFTQTRNGSALDASTLLMPLMRFMAPTDPRWSSHLDAVQSDLAEDALVYRYRTERGVEDGMEAGEGTFTMCSFWYAECLARAGRLPDARLAFEKALGFANHVGLYSEELGSCGEHLGNFPQAFTHLGLISAAYHLDRALSGSGWRA